jgi:hypothetical protein
MASLPDIHIELSPVPVTLTPEFLGAVAKQAMSFYCLLSLRHLMPRPKNSQSVPTVFGARRLANNMQNNIQDTVNDFEL